MQPENLDEGQRAALRRRRRAQRAEARRIRQAVADAYLIARPPGPRPGGLDG